MRLKNDPEGSARKQEECLCSIYGIYRNDSDEILWR